MTVTIKFEGEHESSKHRLAQWMFEKLADGGFMARRFIGYDDIQVLNAWEPLGGKTTDTYDEGGGIIASVSEKPVLPMVDQIDAEVAELLSEEAIKANKEKQKGLEYIQSKAALIARGAALRAFNGGLAQGAARTPDGCSLKLTDDEIQSIQDIRTGVAEVKLIYGEEESVVDPLVAYLRRQWEWSERTFGPGFRTDGILNHIRKELAEVEKEPHDLMEWADIIILALDGYWRHGGSAERLLALLQKKQDKNFARKWPRWQDRTEDQAIEHDRSDEKVEGTS